MKLPEPDSGQRLLLEWFERTGCLHNVFAKAVGVSPPMVNAWLSRLPGRRARPKGDKRQLIDRVTNGDVPERSWETAEEREAIAKVRPITFPKARRAAGGAR